MAKFLHSLCKFASVSISILPSLIFGALIFGGFYASISFLGVKSPVSTCGGWHAATWRSRKMLSDLLIRPELPSLTIFTAPTRPLSNSSDDIQHQALRSWLRLQPTPKVVLLGKDPSFHKAANQLCDKVSVEPNIDYNLGGTPLVNSMFARAEQESTDISIIIDAHTFLFQDFMDALHRVHRDHEKWTLFGKPRDINREDVANSFAKTGRPGLIDNKSTLIGFPTTCEKIADPVISEGYLQGPVSYWAWNNLNKEKNSTNTLLQTAIPPFAYLPGTFEEWILRHLINKVQMNRTIVDTTEAIASVRITSNFSLPVLKEEAHINEMLSSESDHDVYSTSSIAPWKLIRCSEPKIRNHCLVKQNQQASTVVKNNGRLRHAPQPSDLHITGAVRMSNPHTLDTLLPQVADGANLVVMVGGTSNYKEMLLSFICRAQSLGIQNILIAAFDEALYEYAYLQGLPVYLEAPSDVDKSSIGSDGECIFASECFKRVSKLKSMSVLKVLKKGYSVLWSDMDIVWFENPVPQLLAFEPDAVIIQSDEPNETLPENNILGANSGFYLARSNNYTIQAFEAIVQHAMKSNTTEQPSFYIILCGEKGERRVGSRECLLGENGLRTVFLNHQQYPNGHVYLHWDSPNATESCKEKGCVLLHNNFIAGKENKLMRFLTHGLWFYDISNRMCIQPWHPKQPQIDPSAFQANFLAALNITQPQLT